MKALRPLRRWIGGIGIALLGAALAYAPVAAFHDDMARVSGAGIAGAILVLVAWLLPAPRSDEPPQPPDAATPDADRDDAA